MNDPFETIIKPKCFCQYEIRGQYLAQGHFSTVLDYSWIIYQWFPLLLYLPQLIAWNHNEITTEPHFICSNTSVSSDGSSLQTRPQAALHPRRPVLTDGLPPNPSRLSSPWSSWSWSPAIGRERWASQTASPPAPSLPSPAPRKCPCRASGPGPRTAAPQTWWTWRSRWRTPWQTFRWPAPPTCTGLRCCGEEKEQLSWYISGKKMLLLSAWNLMFNTHKLSGWATAGTVSSNFSIT